MQILSNNNFQDSLLTNSEQNPLHRLIELFFTDTGVSKEVSLWVVSKQFVVGDNRPISGQPTAATRGTWNPGLEESGAASPEAGGGDPRREGSRRQGDLYNGSSRHQGHPRMNRISSEEGFTPEEETDSEENEPAMTPRLQRQQSSILLLDKVRDLPSS